MFYQPVRHITDETAPIVTYVGVSHDPGTVLTICSISTGLALVDSRKVYKSGFSNRVRITGLSLTVN